MEDKKPPSNWPPQGNVEFRDYSVRYREGLDLVLKNLSLQVKGGEKVPLRPYMSASTPSAQVTLEECVLSWCLTVQFWCTWLAL